MIARVAVLPLKGGVIELLNNTITKTLDGAEIQIQLDENQTYIESLGIHFDIKLDASCGELKPFLK